MYSGELSSISVWGAYLEVMDNWEYKIDFKGSDGNVVEVMDNYTYLCGIFNFNGSFCKKYQ